MSDHLLTANAIAQIKQNYPPGTRIQLIRMEDQEGLVLQGCGGPLQDWLDGINSMLTQVGILKNGTALCLD